MIQCYSVFCRIQKLFVCAYKLNLYIDTPSSLRVWDSIGAVGGFCFTKPTSSSNFYEIHSVDAAEIQQFFVPVGKSQVLRRMNLQFQPSKR